MTGPCSHWWDDSNFLHDDHCCFLPGSPNECHHQAGRQRRTELLGQA